MKKYIPHIPALTFLYAKQYMSVTYWSKGWYCSLRWIKIQICVKVYVQCEMNLYTLFLLWELNRSTTFLTKVKWETYNIKIKGKKENTQFQRKTLTNRARLFVRSSPYLYWLVLRLLWAKWKLIDSYFNTYCFTFKRFI